MRTSALLFNQLTGKTYDTDGSYQNTSKSQRSGPQVVQGGVVSDWLNMSSASSIGVHVSKSLFGEHRAYLIQSGIVMFNAHFITEARRHLSFEVTDSRFSASERRFYELFIEYNNGKLFRGETLLALQEFDFWLVEEIKGNPHPTVQRTFGDNHLWMKIKTREI